MEDLPHGDALSKPFNPEALKEFTRRAELIRTTQPLPEWFFVCGNATGIFTFHMGAAYGVAMLLFTSRYAAQDYIRATNIAAGVRAVQSESLPGAAETWAEKGVRGFALNRCPRCNTMNAIPLDAMKDKDRFHRVWAIRRAQQLWAGVPKFQEFLHFQSTSRPRARAALEAIRDHVDCGTPYVHELIAFYAALDSDEAARAAAVERLQEFGPPFSDWESRWVRRSDGSSPVTNSLAEAFAGMAKSLGLTPRQS